MSDERESQEPELAADLAAVELQLMRLTPAGPRIDRDRLMFEAGRASVTQPKRLGYIAEPSRLGNRFWPVATTTMTAATLLLSTMLINQRQELQIARNQHPPAVPTQPAATQPSIADVSPPTHRRSMSAISLASQSSKTGYLGTRFVVLTRGVNAIDTPLDNSSANFAPTNNAPPTRREMMNELLPASNRLTNPKS